MPLTVENANSVIEVDLAKVKRNIEKIKRHIGPNVEILYTAKSNGYGHGLVEPVFFMQKECGIKYFSTGMVSEAIELRDAGFNGYLLVMGGVPASAVKSLVQYDLVATLFDVETVNKLAEEARLQGKKVKAHIKVETGFNRLGVKTGKELQALLNAIKNCPEIEIEGVFTHLGNSYSPDKSFTEYQLSLFKKALDQINEFGIHPTLVHAAASGGCVNVPESHFNLVRLAALIFGLDISTIEKNKLGLEPCIKWTSFVSNVRWIEPGESVSYYRWFVAERPVKIAVLGFGMGDGYVRTLATKDIKKNADVIIHGKRARLIDVNVDQTFVDVTNIEDVKIGDTATLLGKDGSEEITSIELGNVGGTSSGHICCSITGRPFRSYIHSSGK